MSTAEHERHDVPAGLRVFLSCDDCPAAEISRHTGYIDWVADSTEADVHVLGSRDTADERGVRYELIFVGRDAFAGQTDTLRFRSSVSETEAAVLQRVQLGLVRYVAATALASHLRVSFEPDTSIVRTTAPQHPASPRKPREQTAEPAKRWAAALDLGFTGSSGNSELIALTTGVRVRHLQTKHFRLDGSVNFRYGESQGHVAARHVQSKLEFDMGPDVRIAPFVSMAGERDPFRKFDLRSQIGTGIRYGFYKGDHGEASLRMAALYNHERFTPQANLSARSDGAWRFEFKGNQRLGTNVKIENASSFDPVMGDFEDFIMNAKSKLSTRITARLALTLGHTYSYDSTPVQGVRRADQRFEAGLTIDF